MSITSKICKCTYNGDGENRSWEVSFPFLSSQDLVIYVTNTHGQESVVSTGYEINSTQGMVIFPTIVSGLDPLSEGERITILRRTPLTQEITLTQQGVFDARMLEQGFDKLTLHVQELAEESARSLKYPVSSSNSDTDAQHFLAEITENQTNLSAALQTEQNSRQQADLSLQQSIQLLTNALTQQDVTHSQALSQEIQARQAADNVLETTINQLNFIQFVSALPQTGNSKYIYAVAQEETDLENHPIVILYVWDGTDLQWCAVGAFSINIEGTNLMLKDNFVFNNSTGILDIITE